MKKPTLKKLIIFLQVELFNHKLETLYILGRNTKDPKNKHKICIEKVLDSYDAFVIFTAVKHRETHFDGL